MGDSRIYVMSWGSLSSLLNTKSAQDQKEEASSSTTWSIASTFDTDSSLKEVVDFMLDHLKSTNSSTKDKIFTFNSTVGEHESETARLVAIDVTTHPPVDITSTIQKYGDKSGPKSITLYDMKWYPSGKVLLCLNDDVETKEFILSSGLSGLSHLLDNNYEYNKVTSESIGRVDSHSRSTLLPSQIFQAIQDRHVVNDELRLKDSKRPLPSNSALESSIIQKERNKRLDAKLKDLDTKLMSKSGSKTANKNKRITKQVRNMLIKSRSEGESKLRQEERIYLELVVFQDDFESCEESGSDTIVPQVTKNNKDVEPFFRFYSRATTIGKATSTVLKKFQEKEKILNLSDENFMSEFLISSPSPSGEKESSTWCRLSNNMVFHDAIRKEYVRDFDRVVVRIFNKKQATQTQSIEDFFSKKIEQIESVPVPVSGVDIQNNIKMTEETNNNEAAEIPSQELDNSARKISLYINKEIKQFELHSSESDTKKKKSVRSAKSSSATDKAKNKKTKKVSKQVQNMLMKSRSTGDKKLKLEERVYIEVLVFQDHDKDNSSKRMESIYKYFSRSSNIGKAISTVTGPASKNSTAEFLISIDQDTDSPLWMRLPSNMCFSEALQKNYLKEFDRVVVRVFGKTMTREDDAIFDYTPCISE